MPENVGDPRRPGEPRALPEDAAPGLPPEERELDPTVARRLTLNQQGLVPAVVQEAGSGDVLMLAWMDPKALAHTLATRQATYWSRSRQEYWIKGATSGHTQYVREVRLDCDGDTVLLVVEQQGGACHTGDHTCFDADQVLAPEEPRWPAGANAEEERGRA